MRLAICRVSSCCSLWCGNLKSQAGGIITCHVLVFVLACAGCVKVWLMLELYYMKIFNSDM